MFHKVRILRMCKVLTHSGVKRVKELHMLVSGFMGAVKAIAFGALLILLMLVCVSIPVVQHIHPVNLELDHGGCDRCSRSYETVLASSLTLYQQIVAADNWGEVSVPNIEKSWKAAVGLPFLQILIGLGMMNLILAAILIYAEN